MVKLSKRLVVLAAIFLILSARVGHAQFIGYAAQQIVTKTVTVGTVSSGPQIFIMPNFGQAAHQLQYTWPSGGFGPCSIEIQGSADAVNFVTLAVGPGPPAGGSAYNSTTYANGYFFALQIVVDKENSNCAANGSLTFSYVGYQNPLPFNPTSQTVRLSNVAGGSILTAAVNAGGAGYVVNDIVSVTGGGGTGGQLKVTTIGGGGAVTGLSITAAGRGYTNTNGAATGGGSGAGLTVNITTGLQSGQVSLPQIILSEPEILTGFECSNANASSAFLQIYSQAAAPTLGTGQIFEVALPASAFQGGSASSFVYSGPPIQGPAAFWFAAVTTLGGSTPVATAIVCDFQINLRGPFIQF